MGQLFNRLKEFAKSFVFDDTSPSVRSFSSLLDTEDEELKRLIDEVYKRSNSNTKGTTTNASSITIEEAYRILNLQANATIEEIKSAFRKKIKEFHPDRVNQFDTELRKQYEENAKKIIDSYNLLRKTKGF